MYNKQEAIEGFQEFSRNKLGLEVGKRVTTAFIYSIAEMEKDFADIFMDNDEELASPEEYRERFQKWRKKILDNGNNQLRKLLDELVKYDVTWKGTICE